MGRAARESRLEGLATEARDPAGAELDLRSTRELVEADERARRERSRRRRRRGEIATAIDAIVERLRARRPADLRRSGILRADRRASTRRRCESTFADRAGPGGRPRCGRRETAARAGGRRGRRAAGAARCARWASARDAVVGMSASGRTPYVVAALEAARAGGGDRCVVSARRLRARRGRRPRDRRRRRPRGRRRLDAAQGRNGAEARAQHDLDGRDDPARQDLRRPDGRRRASNEKLRARVRRIVALATGASEDEVEDALDRGRRRREGRDRRAARRGSAPARRAQARKRAGGDIRKALEAMRLGVEAALVDGALVRGDVEIVGGRVAGVRARGAERARHRGARLRRPPGERLRRHRPARRRRRRLPPRGRSAAGDRRHRLAPHLHHAPEETTCSRRSATCPRKPGGPGSSASTSRGRSSPRGGSGSTRLAARRDPDPALLERLLDAGPVRLMTLAPSCRSEHQLIGRLHAAGGRPSPAVTRDATAEEANAAFDRGVRTVTHLFNAMRPFGHRDPGIAGAALTRDDVVVQIDPRRRPPRPESGRIVWSGGRRAASRSSPTRWRAPAWATATTSSARSRRRGRRRGAREDGVLAGSTLTMIEAVRNLARLGAPLGRGGSGSDRGARRVLGIPRLGRLRCRAAGRSVVVLDDELEIDRVWSGARRVSSAEPVPAATGRAIPRGDPGAARGAAALLAHAPRSRGSPATRARAARGPCAWSATARPTTRPRTASTPSGCFRAGPRCATRSR